MSSVKHAVILKGSAETSEDGKDPYAEKIEALGVKSHVIPALSFEFINENELKSCLDQPGKYSGIVFSSPRCVDSVKSHIKLTDWVDKDVYVVGDKTAQSASQLGLTRIQGQTTGNGSALADFILSRKKGDDDSDCRLLVPASDISRDALVTRLRDNGVTVDQVAAYRTLPNPNLGSRLTPLLSDQQVDVMIFFSPSGVDAAHPFLTKVNTENIKFGAIGTTTEEALKRHSLKVSFVAEKPNPDSVLKALQSFIQ